MCRAKVVSYHPALVIYDEFKGKLTDALHAFLDSNHVYVVKVPPNCTDVCNLWTWLLTNQ